MARAKYLLIIPGRSTHAVADLAQASSIYCQKRDESGEGASTFPDGIINDYGMNVARVSYNGKVWDGPYSETGNPPLYDPYA